MSARSPRKWMPQRGAPTRRRRMSAAGRTLFQGKGNCNSCHLDGFPRLNPGPNPGVAADTEPLFHLLRAMANLGLPLKSQGCHFSRRGARRIFFGFNPQPTTACAVRDLRFGHVPEERPRLCSQPELLACGLSFACPLTDGQMQTSTTRNVAMTPTQCPTTEAGQVDANEGSRSRTSRRSSSHKWLYQEPEAARPFLQYA